MKSFKSIKSLVSYVNTILEEAHDGAIFVYILEMLRRLGASRIHLCASNFTGDDEFTLTIIRNNGHIINKEDMSIERYALEKFSWAAYKKFNDLLPTPTDYRATSLLIVIDFGFGKIKIDQRGEVLEARTVHKHHFEELIEDNK